MTTSPTLGVTVARFQVATLHEGHRHLIETMRRENDESLLLIGDRIKLPGARNPLPYQLRKRMLQETFPDLPVDRLWDTPSDTVWSQQLDALVRTQYPEHRVTLYCSRDGFVDHYSGDFPVRVIDEHPAESGTEQRARIYAEATTGESTNVDFRRGYIAASVTRFPIVFSTVDVAIVSSDHTMVLLGQRASDKGQWRFPGGFMDPTDENRRAAAKREVREECGDIEIEITDHLGDFRVHDFRYRDEADEVQTDLFLATYVFGAPRAGDDLDALAWFPIEELSERLIDNHQTLGQAVLAHLSTRKGVMS